MRFATGSATDQGLLRGNNEDAFLVDGDHALFAVADGMGGHRGGEVASHTAIEALRASFASGDEIKRAIELANTRIIERASGDDELEGMGTTVTAVTVAGPNQLLIGHVGDSRAYLLHDGNIRRVTEDHTLVEELVRDGRLTPEQADAHPQRAIVTRALGIDASVNVALYFLDVEAGDRLLLCSDGLNAMLRDREIEAIARTQTDPQRTAEALVTAANDAGGEDNITVVVIDIVEADGVDPDASGAAAAAGAATAEPVAHAEPAAEAEGEREPRPKGSRLRSLRGALLVLLPVVLILAVAAGALGWYTRRSYYVGVAGNEVVVYKGVPGGVVGWNPTVEERSGIRVDELTPVDRGRVQANTARGSRATAEGFVTRLRAGVAAANATTTTTTTVPRTTTTVKRRTTTTTKPPAGP